MKWFKVKAADHSDNLSVFLATTVINNVPKIKLLKSTVTTEEYAIGFGCNHPPKMHCFMKKKGNSYEKVSGLVLAFHSTPWPLIEARFSKIESTYNCT